MCISLKTKESITLIFPSPFLFTAYRTLERERKHYGKDARVTHQLKSTNDY
jgi:hypothetical protein